MLGFYNFVPKFVACLVVHSILSDFAFGAEEVSFNGGFLNGQSRGMDLSRYSSGNPTLAGVYSADIYVNGRWKGSDELVFSSVEGEAEAKTCYTLESLEGYGVGTSTLAMDEIVPDSCLPVGGWISGASERFDTSVLRLDISIPQENLRRSARGYVDPRLWDPGVTAGRVEYTFNGFSREFRGLSAPSGLHSGDRWESDNSALLSLNMGFNIGAWQFRQDSSWRWLDGEGEWQDIASYARRPLPGWQSELTLGEAHTDGQLFDSVGFRGARLASDDRMLPDSLRGYAPEVRGVAESNALVEIRQRGQLIYQDSVPPGPFVIDDLYPTGYGGDLEVTVTEADGRERRFTVPYASVVQMLRPGHRRYSLTVGEVREAQLESSPWLAQATYQQGVTNRLTGYAGATLSEGYGALLGGGALGTPIGAFSFDMTQAQTRFERGERRSGRSIRAGYSRLISETGTNITIAAYRYSNDGYLGLRDAVLSREYERQGVSTGSVLRQRREFQLALNQSLPGTLGSIYLTGSWREFWGGSETVENYQLGYNSRLGPLSYGVSALWSQSDNGEDDTQYALNVSLPITSGAGAASLTGALGYSDGGYESSRLGVSGSLGEAGRLTYHTSLSHVAGHVTTGELAGQYQGDRASLRAAYSHSRNHRQASIGASGTLVAHAGGLTMTSQRGDTLVLVEAPEATGAGVAGSRMRIDRSGYGVMAYAAPYRLNSVTLDPAGMPEHVEFKSSQQQVAPYAGAIAHLRFETITGRALLITARRPGGEPLTFGASVYDDAGQPVAIVGQGGRIYLRTERDSGVLRVGDGEECWLSYDFDPMVGAGLSYTYLEASCDP